MSHRAKNLTVEEILMQIRYLSQLTTEGRDLSTEGNKLRQQIHQGWLSLDANQRHELERCQGDLLKSLFKPLSNQNPL